MSIERKSQRPVWGTLMVYRGFALCAMIGLHTTFLWLYEQNTILNPTPQRLFFLFSYISLLGWFVLSFAVTTGISFFHWYESAAEGTSFQSLLMRCLLLICVGFYLNPRSWFIFQFLGVSCLVAFPLVMARRRLFLYALGVGVFLLYIPLQQWLVPYEGTVWKAILVGDDSDRYLWPLLPWFSLFVLGVGIAHLRTTFRRLQIKLFNLTLLFCGLLLIDISLVTGTLFPDLDLNRFWGPGFFQPKQLTLLGWTGLILASIPIFDLVLRTRFRVVLSWLGQLSPNTLFLYVILSKTLGYAYKVRSDSLLRLLAVIGVQIAFAYIFSLGMNRLVLKLKKVRLVRSPGKSLRAKRT